MTDQFDYLQFERCLIDAKNSGKLRQIGSSTCINADREWPNAMEASSQPHKQAPPGERFNAMEDENGNLPVIIPLNGSSFATTYPSPANYSSPKSSSNLSSKKSRRSRRYFSSPYMVWGHFVGFLATPFAELAYCSVANKSGNDILNTW